MMKVIKTQLKLPNGDGVWILKFSVGNFEALSSASHQKDCDRSSTDYWCQVPWDLSPTRLKSSQGLKNVQHVAPLKISACSQAMNLEICIPTVLMIIEKIRERMIS